LSVADKYAELAERYDRMLQEDPAREAFFKRTFERFQAKSILDCACGTGNDLLLFHSMGYNVIGSDLSDSMLKMSQRAIDDHKASIILRKGDFQNLQAIHCETFDAIVCLSNSINEADVDPIAALQSMKQVLRPDGIVILDQGQTDLSMQDPPSYVPMVNDQSFSRLFTMTYDQGIMTVSIFDFIHDEKESRYDFNHSEFKIRIRLHADWKAILKKVNLKAEFYGNWQGEEYDSKRSKRLIIVARK
jgi:glycine/sarcosine N-methyltransferase